MIKRHSLLLSAALLIASGGMATAQQLFIYPAKGQSQEQLGKDRYECHTWAVQQTGFDPTNPQSAQAPAQAAPPPPSEPQQGGLLRGAGRGAAIGAVGGAIGGDAGRGAAIGAATGALIGGFRRRDQQRRQASQHQQWQRQQAQVQAQQQQAMSGQRSNYNRAMSACLTARGYTVN
jgi:predicted lipid-binding transport protein (Tim44 family)